MGFRRAGFKVHGMDKDPQPRYPFKFFQYDICDAAGDLRLDPKWIRKRYQAVVGSPPCQFHSPLYNLENTKHALNLIPQTRELLEATGLPYIIENVVGARDHLIDPIMLCGTEFFLGAQCRDGVWRELRRHRLFESNVPISRLSDCYHEADGVIGCYGAPGGQGTSRGYKGYVDERRDAMEIDWMSNKGMAQALPPAYTEHLGKQLLEYV